MVANDSASPVADRLTAFELSIVTPHGVTFRGWASSVRVPTETGLVGVRPRSEPMTLVVESGLILIHGSPGEVYAATAGGLLRVQRKECQLLTPYAAVGTSEDEMDAILQSLSATPPEEMQARHRLEELEQRVVDELARVRQGGAGDGH